MSGNRSLVAPKPGADLTCLLSAVNFTAICDAPSSGDEGIMEAGHMEMDPTSTLFTAPMEFYTHPGGPAAWLGHGAHQDDAAHAAAHDASLIMALSHHGGPALGSNSGPPSSTAYTTGNEMPEFGLPYPNHALAALSLRGQSPHAPSHSPVQNSSPYPAVASSVAGSTAGGLGVSTSTTGWTPDLAGHNTSLSPSMHSAHMVPGSARSGPSPGFPRSTSSPSSRGSSRAASPGVSLDRQRSSDEGLGSHVRSLSSPAIALRGAARTRNPSFGSQAQKSPLRSGFGMTRGSPSTGSPLPNEDEEEDTSPCSPGRRAHDDSAADDAGPIKRVRGSIARSSSLPMTSRRPPLSPVVSPRVSRRASRVMDSDHESPAASPVPTAVPHAHHPPARGAASDALEGVLVLAVAPSQFGRFRYEAEGRQNCIEGEERGTYPTVAIAQDWAALCPDGTIVTVSLVRRDDMRPHHHVLAAKDGGPTAQPLVRGRATFSNLVVKRQRSDVRYPSEDQRAVRLLFSVSFPRDGSMVHAQVVSPPIFNSDLKINRVSHKAGPMHAPTDVMLFCSKVQKKSVGVLITDDQSLSFLPEVADTWVRTADGGHLFLVQHGIEVHHQYGLAFRFPPCFETARAGVSVPVFFQLVDVADSIASDFEAFTYITPEYDTNI